MERDDKGLLYPIRVIGDGNRYVCHYCGVPADTLDHVPPVSRYDDARAMEPMAQFFRVPACRECNILAGAELHISFFERAAFVKERLADKYRKQLRVVEWTEDELAEMSYAFRVSIRRNMKAKLYIESRLNFFPS